MQTQKLILCMKWGSRYGPQYVNNLYSMVRRNITGPFRLICFTDDSEKIDQEVEIFPIPELGVEIPPGVPGKWPKQALWAKDLFGLEGVALFLDLDNVIMDSLDPYFDIGTADDVFTARNWVKPWLKQAQTSVFRFRIGSQSHLLENIRQNPDLMSKYQMEQAYVSACVKGGVKFWPYQWTKHFRRHSLHPWPLRLFTKPVKPRGCRVLTFPGSPDPHQAVKGEWGSIPPFISYLDHVRYIFSKNYKGRSKFRGIKQFYRPASWLSEYWR